MTEFKNEFSWSKTRDEIFKTCPRQYWFAYYKNRHAWGGAARPISAVAMALAVFLLVSALFPTFRKKREKIETEAG